MRLQCKTTGVPGVKLRRQNAERPLSASQGLWPSEGQDQLRLVICYLQYSGGPECHHLDPFSLLCVCACVTVCVSACLVCVYFSFCLNFVQNKRPFNFSNLAYSTPTPQSKIVEGVRSTRAAGAGAAGGKAVCALILTFSCSGFPESPRQAGLMPFLRGQRHLADETSNP